MFICIYVQHISGERLQDHWSSGYRGLTQIGLDQEILDLGRKAMVVLSLLQKEVAI